MDEKKVKNLCDFLNKTYNDDAMQIKIVHPEMTDEIKRYFPKPQVGKNCLQNIKLSYNCKNNNN